MGLLDKYEDEFIDAYLHDELAADDKNKLETDMLADPQLAEYVIFRKKMLATIHEAGKKELSDRISNVGKFLNEEGFFITDEDIDAYLDGSAEPSAKRNIELTALQNNVLQKRIEARKVLIGTIKAQGQLILQKNIAQAANELESTGFFEQSTTTKIPEITKPEKANRVILLRWAVVAASILVLVLAGRLWIYPAINNNNPYQAFFNVPDDKLSQKIEAELSETGFGGSPATSLKELRKGMQLYQQKQYKSSIPILKSYLKQNPMASNVQEVQLYLAVSYMSNNNARKALPYLLAATAAQPRGELAVDVQWYLALCYLQIDQSAEAVSILQSLQSNTKYNTQASRLLEKIEY